MADPALTPQIVRGLNDKLYEKRKAAALEVEKLVREAAAVGDHKRVAAILNALIDDFAYSVVPNSRNGGLISLAAAAIALGPLVTEHLESIVPPILSCFADQDSRVRYYACESMYNVAKVARGDILKYFNEIFDALSKLSADSELSVKNGAELLDRLMKDVVSERSTYYPQGSTPTLSSAFESTPVVPAMPIRSSTTQSAPPALAEAPSPAPPSYPPVPGTVPLLPGMKPTQFNLPRFIPLLSERIHTLAPFTRMFLVQWISVLDSVPDLELIAYLPDFLDGLFNYLSDPNVDVRVATLNVLGEFLKEIRDVVEIQRERGALKIRGKDAPPDISEPLVPPKDAHPDTTAPPPAYSHPTIIEESEENTSFQSDASEGKEGVAGLTQDVAQLDIGAQISIAAQIAENDFQRPQPATGSLPYVPGQNVVLDIGRMTEILGSHLLSTDEETQATALRWVNEFILLAREVMLPYGPMLLNAILTSLSHSVPAIRNIANETNANLYKLVLDIPINPPIISVTSDPSSYLSTSPQSMSGLHRRTDSSVSIPTANTFAVPNFDIRATVEALTLQFQDDHEETRVAALDWLLMLHRKAPKQMMSSDDSTFQALLRTLSDASEEVVKRDLQLLAQISQASDDEYFTRFMVNLLSLFSTDRRLLEARGSLIIRQLCLSLNPERMYRTFAEILERDDDLDFASIMVQNLNIILITAPELGDLRRRLRNLDMRDGSHLFTSLYRSWCHNAVATFSLCLLAQAYEHAANLLQTFADLEITVSFLIQIDKLVQLIESPVFTYLRLQLLEPDRYPHLFKCLYGILMLLPQSSAFATLRNRLNSVSSMVMLYANTGSSSGIGQVGVSVPTGQPYGVGAPPNAPGSPQGLRSPGRSRNANAASDASQGVRWADLLNHFRSVQGRHERYRRIGRNPSLERAMSKRRNRGSRSEMDYTSDDKGGLAPGSPTLSGRQRSISAGVPGPGSQGSTLSSIPMPAPAGGYSPNAPGAVASGRVSPANIGNPSSSRFPRGLSGGIPTTQAGSPNKPGMEGTRLIKKMPPPPAAPGPRK
ncbi:hypothetical protein HDV00_000817 [Rhizophlyctis rosea]|nr:hypothetical protein HDV00_000817 [Rhizophlyctis rosea]